MLSGGILKKINTDSFYETSRLFLYVLIFFIGNVNYFAKPHFIDWTETLQFYSFIMLGLVNHLLVLYLKEKGKNTFYSFFIDAIVINLIMSGNTQLQSFFIFFNLINILIAGLVLQVKGGLMVSLFTGIMFTLQYLIGPEIPGYQGVVLLAVNNFSFFLVAGISGLLSDKFLETTIELENKKTELVDLKGINNLVLENSPIGIVSFFEDGELLNTNLSFARMTHLWKIHYSLSSDAENIWKLFDLDSAAIINEIKLKGFSKFEVKNNLLDGVQVLQLQIVKTWSAQVKKNIFILLIDDLTEVRRMQNALIQSEKMAAVGQLAAGIAHEIRNPLAGISGSIELLSLNLQSDDDRKLMKIILREIDRLNLLISEFLDYSKPELEPTDTVNLTDLINEVLDSLQFNSKIRKDVELIKEIPSSVKIIGDSNKLKQVFLNLVINAYQAMEKTENPRLTLKLTQNNHQHILEIIDSGCGMSEETLRRMFEPFHTTKAKGTGLGLAVTLKILKAHKAEIHAESKMGHGTRFEIVFNKIK